jgi:ATP-binding cassette, subfamily C (CFTR/MRP), member 1
MTEQEAIKNSDWVNEGTIEFKDVELRYRPNTDLVLKGLNFKIEPRSKVGIVGRTGAGKSTISLAISRIVEIEKGAILIDGVDSKSIKIDELRSKITIIP